MKIVSAPGFTLLNDPLDNRYLEVDYQTSPRAGLHAEFETGIQIALNEQLGIIAAANYVVGSVNRMYYTYDAIGTAFTNGDGYISQNFDHLSLHIGLSFRL